MSNTRNIREPSINALRTICAEKQAAKLRFRLDTGKTKLVLVDLFTASAIVRVYDLLSDDRQSKVSEMVEGGLGSFLRVQSFAMKAL